MAEKTCKTCGETKPIEDYYRNPGMADGYLNFCNACVKVSKKEHRTKNLDGCRELARRAAKAWNKRRAVYVVQKAKDDRKNFPEKFRARDALKYAVRTGKLIRLPCEICGKEKAEGHHEDYSRPLDVNWLCRMHHAERHRAIRGEG